MAGDATVSQSNWPIMVEIVEVALPRAGQQIAGRSASDDLLVA
jgi:hypothetical protein